MALRTVDRQIDVQDAQHRRADSLLRLAVAESGALVLVLGFFPSTVYGDSLVFRAFVVAAILLSFAAVASLAFVLAGGRPRHSLEIGPDVATMVVAIDHSMARLEEIDASIVGPLAAATERNADVLEHTNLMLTLAVTLLGSAAVSLLGASAYILGALIDA